MRGTEKSGWAHNVLFGCIGIVIVALLAGAFLPIAQCPACEDERKDFGAIGIDLASAKSRIPCQLCNDLAGKVSILKYWKYRRAHPT